MANMFAAFAGAGALSGIGQGMMHERNLQESYDMHTKFMQEQLDYNKQLDASKEQTKEQERLAEIKAKMGELDPNSKALVNWNKAQEQGKIPLGGGQDNSQPMPGVPQGLDNNNPIVPRTPSLNAQPPQAGIPLPDSGMAAGGQPQPQQGAMQPQAPAIQPQPNQAPAPQGMGINSPQGGPVNLQTPDAVSPQTPAGQIVAQTALQHAAEVKQQGGSDIDAFIAAHPALNSPGAQAEWSTFAKAHNLDVTQLDWSLRDKAQYLSEGGKGTDWYEKHFIPHMNLMEKQLKTAPVDTAQWGKEDTAHYQAMQNAGLIGPKEQLRPLSNSQNKDNEQLVQQAYQMKNAANQGIDTFQRIVHDVSKINPGPGADMAAYVKNAWAQMTGSQRSQALTTYFEGQKEQIQALNAQINSMRAVGGRMVVGAQVLKTEEKGIPDIRNMTPEASLNIAQSYINNYRQMAGQADAIIGGDENISPIKRIQFANEYADKNPSAGPDGNTPNSSFQEFKSWRDNLANGTPQPQGSTGSGNRAMATSDVQGALTDAKAGGKGEVPKDPNIAAIQQGLPAGAKVTRIK